MLKRLIPLFAACALTFAACNSSSQEDEYQYVASTDVAITSFSLLNDSEVLDSLGNVFFSIDLLNAKIFNADSLPYGTPTSRLVTLISANNASGITIKFPRPGATDTVVDYKTSSTDSIDFSNGPVTITIVSESGTVSRDYEVKVNVHQVKPDTLAWERLESAPLPSSFSDVKAQYTARKGDTFYCLTSSASGKYCMATTPDPNSADWQTAEVSFTFTPDVTSLRATADALYILSSDNHLYTSADGSSWTDTGKEMTYLYGAYTDQIVGTDGATILLYPSGQACSMPTGFPVRGTSLPATFTSPMAISEQIVILGGIKADGSFSREAWGFDGTNAVRLSMFKNLPYGVESPVLVAYDLFEVPSSTWSPVQYPALVAFGGKKADGTISRTVYISKDWGMNWLEAPQLMALPADLPALYCQPAFIYSVTMHARTSEWTELGVRKLFPFATFTSDAPISRATKPLTEWECPGIYLFGGIDAAGNTSPCVWRGVISRYTFKPVQ